MPLKRGSNSAAISKNIQELVSKGYPKEQASAIAYEYARETRRKGRKK
jgi:hypothetical protein